MRSVRRAYDRRYFTLNVVTRTTAVRAITSSLLVGEWDDLGSVGWKGICKNPSVLGGISVFVCGVVWGAQTVPGKDF